MWGLFQKKKKEVDESSSTTKLNELESKDYDVNKQTSLLFNAIRKKDIPLIKNLIENGADINKQARSGNTPLILAVQYQLQDIVELLLKKADVNIKNKYNKNALQIAESYGFYEIFWAIKIYMEPNINHSFYKEFKEEQFIQAIKNSNANKLLELLEMNSMEDINIPIYYGMTLLYYAVLFKNLDMVKFLLDKGADLNIKNQEGLTYDHEIERVCYYTKGLPIHINSSPENLVLKEYEEFKKNHADKTPLELATKNNLPDILELFLEVEFNQSINKLVDGVSPLYKAIIDKDVGLAKKLIDNGADIYLKNSDDYQKLDKLDGGWYEHKLKTPLYQAIDSGAIDIFKLFTLKDNEIADLLDYAIRASKTEIALYLIQNSKNLNEKTPLILAFKWRNFEVIESLIDYKVDVNALDKDEKSVLFYAIEVEHIEFIQFLIENRIDVNNGLVPLKAACRKQNFKIIKLLVKHDADVNATYKDGQSALFDAIEVKKANVDIIKFLLDHGADINQEDSKGITPLSFAQSNKKSLVKILTEYQKEQISNSKSVDVIDTVKDYQSLSKKIASQNRIINTLSKELESIRNSDDLIKELKGQIETQFNKIHRLENKLIKKEIETQEVINDFRVKLEEFEKHLSASKKLQKESSIPIDVKIENKSLKRDDGIIVKRESFDDF